MITAILTNNNKFQLQGSLKILMKLRKDMAIKNPNAWHLRRYMPAGWDGFQHYVTDRGYVKMGLLPRVAEWCKHYGHEFVIQDDRKKLVDPVVPEVIGNLKPRPYQAQAIASVVHNKVNGNPFRIGTINAATNAGKTLMMAGLYLSFHRKEKAIVLLNDSDLYNQFKEEMPRLIGEEDFGYVRGKEVVWNNFTIVMVQTISRNINLYKNKLTQFSIALIDEADLGDNKTYKKVIENLYNTNVRVGLSGTIYMSKLKKDAMKNRNLESFFGPEVFTITKREMVDIGHSTELVIKIVWGNKEGTLPGDWQKEYETYITQNVERANRSAQRTKWNIERGRLPALIVCQFHKHIELMHDTYKEVFPNLRVEAVHGDTKNRKKLLEEFRDGKIDILIASMIVKRGKNFPLLRYIQNAAGSDSNETISQIMGRGERQHESKKKTYFDDLYDMGKYLERHSKHRINYYKKEKFKVINLLNTNNGKKKTRSGKRR